MLLWSADTGINTSKNKVQGISRQQLTWPFEIETALKNANYLHSKVKPVKVKME